MRWTEVGDQFLVVPVGSCEQHGPHLPLETDTIIATTLASAIVGSRRDAVLAPALTITASGEHRGFPGTLSIGTDALVSVIVELARSADWASGVVFVNGHGGNTAALRRAGEVFASEAHKVLIWSPSIADGDPHAGRTETSMMLAISPERVRMDRAGAGPTPALRALMEHGVRPLSPTGVLGDPTAATADEGYRLLAHLTDQLERAVADWIERA